MATRIANTSTLGLLIREARMNRGLSQRELADLLGVHQRFIVDLERGRATKAIDRLFAAARESGVELSGELR